MNRGYKIVRRFKGGELVSMCASGELRVQYIPGKKVTSPYGPLMVLDDSEHAYWWWHANYRDGLEAWLCEYEEYCMPVPLKLLPYAAYVGDVKQFWQNPSAYSERNPDLIPTPEGTILARSVMLLRPLQFQEKTI